RRPLGRGLAALFGEPEGGLSEDPASRRRIPIELIRPGAFQPRRRFAEAELEALAQSIREKGVLQPLLVRPLSGQEADFELVAGEPTPGHARAWLAVAAPAALAEEVVRRGLNVRATERLVQRRIEGQHSRRRQVRDADTVGLERELAALLGLRVTLEPKKRG